MPALDFASLATLVCHPVVPTEGNAARCGFRMALGRAVFIPPGAGARPSP
jgi:hypothetical protein